MDFKFIGLVLAFWAYMLVALVIAALWVFGQLAWPWWVAFSPVPALVGFLFLASAFSLGGKG